MRSRTLPAVLGTVFLGAACPLAVIAQQPEFGGPDSVRTTIAEDDKPKESVFRSEALQQWLEPYYDFKSRLAEEHGVTFGLDYSAAYLVADNSAGKDRAASGMLRFFGGWDVIGRESGDTGTVVWKLENRHEYTSNPPSAMAPDLGYVGLIEAPFNDDHWRLTNLYWRQRLQQGRVSVIGGFLDVTDFLDLYALTSPWTGFFNLAFSTGSATIPLPGDAAFGVGGAVMLTDTLYAMASLVDSNADPTDALHGIETFYRDHEFFTTLEVGRTTSQERIYLDNTHVTLWHVDERDGPGVANGWGFNFSTAQYVNDKWLPFLRAGYAHDGGSLLETSVSVGFGYQGVPNQDLLGFGINWGNPNADTFGAGLDNQWTAEVFYRLQLSPNFALTPDLQYIVDPALNPGENDVFVFGLRGRLAF